MISTLKEEWRVIMSEKPLKLKNSLPKKRPRSKNKKSVDRRFFGLNIL